MAIRINVCDADSGGKTGPMLVPDGMSVQNYFQTYKAGRSLSNYRTSINEQEASAHSTLTADCRLNISPNKFGGAANNRRTVAQKARLDVIRSLFLAALAQCESLGNTMLSNTVEALGVLDKPTGEQVDQAIGLIDGNIELERRYGNLVKAERTQVAGDDADDSDLDEVDDTKARAPQCSDLTRGLVRVRVWLSAASTLLHNADRPTANTDQVPVPDKGMSSGQTQPAPDRDRGRRGE